MRHQEAACTGFDVWLHVYDLGLLSKWFLNDWSGMGAFHCGIEVLGVEWSFQAMIGCETDDATGVICHVPKMHPRHVYRESVWLGTSTLTAKELCNVLLGAERDWPAKSYHFLNHNCTDFAEVLAQSLKAPIPFPAWAHGLAKGLVNKEDSDAQGPWWLPSSLNACCGSCASEYCHLEAEAGVQQSCHASAGPACDLDDQLCSPTRRPTLVM